MLSPLGSLRTTMMVVLATTTVASPIVARPDVAASVVHRVAALSAPAAQPAMDTHVAGGFSFARPQAWARLGAESAASRAAQSAGTVVSALCPSGTSGSSCDAGVQLTFVAYADARAKLPLLSTFDAQLDASLPKRLRSFRKIGSRSQPAADGTTWLRYEFDAGRQREVLGVFRHADGSGVVVVAAGPAATMRAHAASIDALLGSARESDQSARSA